MILITRRYRLPAAHVLANPKLSKADNDRVFGKCSNPNGHGHNYEFEVTVSGPIDPRTGQIVENVWALPRPLTGTLPRAWT